MRRNRKIIAILLAAAFAAAGAGCAGQPDAGKAPETTRQLRETQSTAPVEPEVPDAMTYVALEDCVVPVSYTRWGKQILSEEVDSLQGDGLLQGAPLAEELARIPAPEGCGFDAVLSDGDWDFFPDSVEYRSYTPEAPSRHPDWTAYFQERLQELNCDSPLVLKESLRFLWNGVETAVVTASNVTAVDSPELLSLEAIPEGGRPDNQNPGVYVLTALFVQGEQPVALYSRYDQIQAETGADYAPWEGETDFLQVLTAWQYDEQGNAVSYPIYGNMTGQLTLQDAAEAPRCLVSDIDGDNTSELVVIQKTSQSLTSWCGVYDLEQGSARESLRMGLN